MEAIDEPNGRAVRVASRAMIPSKYRMRRALVPVMRGVVTVVLAFVMGTHAAVATASDPPVTMDTSEVSLEPVGRSSTGFFNQGASEIAAHHAPSRRLFVINGAEGLDIIDVADPAAPRRVASRRMRNATSVAVHGDLVAVAVGGASAAARGIVRFFDPEGRDLGRVDVGFGPDMVAFTTDGRRLLVACEGEASPGVRPTDPPIDPPGSISLIDLSRGVADAVVVDAGFDAFEAQREALVERGLRVVTPGATLAADAEPEYVALSPDGRFAFVTLQENNAIAIVDVAAGRVRSIEPLGFRDCSRPGMGFDACADGVAAPRPVSVLAMHQPDAIVVFEHDGAWWLATADEGEARAGTFDEAITLQQALLAFGGSAAERSADGGLLVSCVRAPESFGGGPCAFGSRGVSLWRVSKEALGDAPSVEPAISLAWNSGDELERVIAERTPALFNADHGVGPKVDARSRSKGPEPEGLALGQVAGRRLLFVTLERSGGVVVVDLSDPSAPRLVGYSNPRRADVDLSIDVNGDGVPDHFDDASDLGPEGVIFVPASESPTGEDLLVVCHEVSGTTTILRVRAE